MTLLRSGTVMTLAYWRSLKAAGYSDEDVPDRVMLTQVIGAISR